MTQQPRTTPDPATADPATAESVTAESATAESATAASVTAASVTAESVGRLYDVLTGAGATASLGGNIHVGYWDIAPGTPGARTVSMAEATDRLTDLVAHCLAARPGQRLLDVGCGNGLPAVRIAAAHQVHVTGITVSRAQVTGAAQLADASPGARGRASFRLADAVDLPFGDASYDGAWAIESLLHMPDQTAALTEIHRVVRPGGRLVVTDLCLREPFTGADRALLDGLLGVYEIAGVCTPDEHRAHVADAGWRLLEMTDIGEHVRPGYAHAAAGFRELAAALDPAIAKHLTEAAGLMEDFGRHPGAGYVLITAERP